jgi:hypothetical protein
MNRAFAPSKNASKGENLPPKKKFKQLLAPNHLAEKNECLEPPKGSDLSANEPATCIKVLWRKKQFKKVHLRPLSLETCRAHCRSLRLQHKTWESDGI